MEKALRQKLPGGRFENVSPVRSRAMAAVRGKGNATTERRLRLALVRAGIRGWQLHPKGLSGRPDFFFPEAKLAVFTDGCFWHGCRKCGHVPSKHTDFWRTKIERNRERDKEKTAQLQAQGFAVLRFWEHDLQDDLAECVAVVRDRLERAE